MTTPILKKVGLDDSRPRLLEKLNYNFNRTGAGGLATGFIADNFNQDIDVDYNQTTRKVTLTGTFKAYYEGILIPELTDGWESVAHADTTDTYFLRHDGVQFLFDTTPFNIESDLLIAVVQYGTLKICLREVHGADMNGKTHYQMHYEIGTGRKPSTTALFSNYTPNSTTAADRRPFINGVVLTDEDLHTAVEALNTNSYAQRYLTGSSAIGTRTFTTAQTDIVKLSGNQPYYNQWTGSAWTNTLFPNNDYGAIFVVAIPAAKNADSQAVRYMFCQPQKTSGTLSVIQAITTNDFLYGESTSLLGEYNFIGKIIIRYTASNWVITSIEELTGNKIQQSSGMVGYGLATTTTDGLMSSTDFNRLADASAVNGYVKCNGSGDYSAGVVATTTVDGLLQASDKVVINRIATPTYLQLVGNSATLQTLTTSWVAFKKWNAWNGTGVAQGIMTQDGANGLITCNFDGYIEVSGALHFNGFTAGHALGLRVTKSGTEMIWMYTTTPSVTYILIQIPPVIMAVTSGQTISLEVINLSANGGNAGYNGNSGTIGNILTVRRL